MSTLYKVLIVEDDFRIANIHQQFIENIDDFSVIASVRTGEEAITFLKEQEEAPDLVLLDVYIPDAEELGLFWDLRSKYHHLDIIIISAANEVETVQEAVRGGVFDYIIKPVDIDRFEQTLTRYKELQKIFRASPTFEQTDIDKYIFPKFIREKETAHLPKGIDSITLNEITSLLTSISNTGTTAVELSKQIGTSRSTARRYLEYLVSINKIETRLKYGSVGRPERTYYLRETYEQKD